MNEEVVIIEYGMDISIHNQLLASYSGRVGGERWPGIECLCMCNHSQKNLEICLHLETVGKINTCMFVWNSIHNKNKGLFKHICTLFRAEIRISFMFAHIRQYSALVLRSR